MTTTTHDPIFLNDDSNTGTGPLLLKGEGNSTPKIYFDPENNGQEYLITPLHGSDGGGAGFHGTCDANADSPVTSNINQAKHRLNTKEKHNEQLRNASPQDWSALRRSHPCRGT
jgi:hypothetical protein